MKRYIITYDTGIYEDNYNHSYGIFSKSKDEIKEKFIKAIDEWKSKYPDHIKPNDWYLLIDSEHFAACEDTWPEKSATDIFDSFGVFTLDEFFEVSRPHKE